jgi:DNA-binding NarL/FixJ family response regulator
VYEVNACHNCFRRFRTLNISAERSPEALRKRIHGAQSVADILKLSPPKQNSQAAESFLTVLRELDREEKLVQNVISELRKQNKRLSSQPRRRKLSLSKFWPKLQKAGLTNRQIECLLWRYEGLPVAGIAKKLRLHHSTVQGHIKVAEKKLENNPSLIKSLGM